MKILGKTIQILFTILLVGVTGLFLVSLLPIPGNIEVRIVKSGSMEPTIMTGAITIVKPWSSYKVGDIIMFGKDTKRDIPTTHRIVSVVKENGTEAFMTKGDANEESDPSPVHLENIIGKVVFSAPYVGYILDFAKKPIGFVLLIGVPALMIILDEIIKIFTEIKNIRRKKKKNESESDGQKNNLSGFKTSVPNDNVSGMKMAGFGQFYSPTLALPVSVLIDGIVPRSLLKAQRDLTILKQRKQKRKKSLGKALMIVIAGFGSVFSLISIGGTMSYFTDTEKSSGNIFRASGVDLVLSAANDIAGRFAALTFGETEASTNDDTSVGSETFEISVSEGDASSPVIYSLEGVIEDGSPATCGNLHLLATHGDYTYSGIFSGFGVSDVKDTGLWSFTVSVPEDGSLAPDAVCSGEIIFRAYPRDAGGAFSGIYRDEEKYYFSVKNYGEPQKTQGIQSLMSEPTVFGTSTESTSPSENNTEVPPTEESTSTPDVLLEEPHEETASTTPEIIEPETESEVTTPPTETTENIEQPIEETNSTPSEPATEETPPPSEPLAL